MYFDGPNSTLVAMGVLLTLSLLLLGMGFSRPLQRPGIRSNAYSQAGTFSYLAPTKAPTPVYPTGVVETGDPIYPSLVDTVSMRFRYRFASSLPHHVKGTIEMRALLLSKSDTWQELSTVVPVTKFSGDANVGHDRSPAVGPLHPHRQPRDPGRGRHRRELLGHIQPVVHVTGTVGGQSIDTKL